MNATAKEVSPAPLLKLDFGCGPNKRDGFHGVDQFPFDGKVDTVMNIVERVSYTLSADVVTNDKPYRAVFEAYPPGPPQYKAWPWADDSVDEAHTSHFVEHLSGAERVHFFNELYRVLKPGAQVQVIVPAWSHERAYGDPTHAWPPCSGWLALYLSKSWRDQNAPHTGYTCDFAWTSSGTWDAWLETKHIDVKIHNMQRSINSTSDIIFNLTKPAPPAAP